MGKHNTYSTVHGPTGAVTRSTIKFRNYFQIRAGDNDLQECIVGQGSGTSKGMTKTASDACAETHAKKVLQ